MFPHPAFGGKPRELVAEDFVYSWKRVADPALSSMSWAALEGRIDGLDERVGRARRDARPFDLAAPVAGLRAAGIRAYRAPGQGMYLFLFLFLFNMRDPVVGGLTVPATALRRAIAMAIDDATWLETFKRGVGTVRQHVIGPDVAGFAMNPYLPLPCHLLDVAAPAR
jgi:ABC-type transport system substrate-binding protein